MNTRQFDYGMRASQASSCLSFNPLSVFSSSFHRSHHHEHLAH